MADDDNGGMSSWKEWPAKAGEFLRNLFDLQFQHALPSAGMHALVWGGEYRYGIDRLRNSDIFAFLPAAASRTVRAPSRLDRDAFVPSSPPFLLAGGAEVRSEVANVYEVGYRGQPADRVSYSVTAFHADYDHLRTQEIAASRTFLFFANGMEGTTSGVEIWGSYQASPSWRLRAGFTRAFPGLRSPRSPLATMRPLDPALPHTGSRRRPSRPRCWRTIVMRSSNARRPRRSARSPRRRSRPAAFWSRSAPARCSTTWI